MNSRTRPILAPWISRLKAGDGQRHPGPRSEPPMFAPRPGIAARWKPRDRVSATGN